MTDISIVALVADVGDLEEHSCPDVQECSFPIPSGDSPGLAIYGASTTDSNGHRGRAPAAYIFQIGTPPGADTFPLRVPFDIYEGQRSSKILLVRDNSYDTDSDVLRDAETLVYDSLLEDPAYRWRDNQLGFYYTLFPGATSDYHSGIQNRCGQRPWLGDLVAGTAQAAAAFADIVAVIHQNDSYRDCAEACVLTPGTGVQCHFSAYGGQAEVFHHELGHALAGLSDEYWESTTDRTPRADALEGFDDSVCRCCHPGMELLFCELRGLPPCDTLPVECFPADLTCPALGSSCRHPNVFSSETECMAAATASTRAEHPGLELDAPSECRLLCAPSLDDALCPCDEGAQVWILDLRYPPAPDGTAGNDMMGGDPELGEWVGPACERCTEFVFCRQWEMGRGQSQADAEDYCVNP